ncbi:YggU family protein [bacterium]|nr:YggU family protein [bacterium]
MFKKTDEGIILKLRISPNSSKNEIIKTDEILKIKVTAQPIENKANKALIEFLSKTFKIPKSSISILKGETSKDKTLLLKVTDEEKINAIRLLIM